MFDPVTFGVFFTACLLLAIAPGPGMLYVLARSLGGGRREGILSSLGTFIGGMFHVFAAALGVSAILATSAIAFSLVKYAGAAYLVYLGVRMLLSQDAHEIPRQTGRQGNRAFAQGVVTEVLNPKTALFFLAFIPQFIHHESGSVFWQFVLLGSISVTLNTLADLVVAVLAGPLGAKMRSSLRFRKGQRIVTGTAMIALGAYVAIGERK